MPFKQLLSLILHVLGDWRVIVTVIAMLIVVTFAKFITSYKKKGPKTKKDKKGKTAAPAPAAPEPPKSDMSEKDSG